MLGRYLEGSCSRRWFLLSGHKYLHSDMARGCRARRGFDSAVQYTLEGSGSGKSQPHLHKCHRLDTDKGFGHTHLHPACRFGHGSWEGMCTGRWNQKMNTVHHLHMGWKHMGWEFGKIFLKSNRGFIKVYRETKSAMHNQKLGVFEPSYLSILVDTGIGNQ